MKARKRRPREEICVERNNDVGIRQAILRIDKLTKGGLGCSISRVAVYGTVLDELCLRKCRLPSAPLAGKSWRGNCIAKEIQTLPTICLLIGKHGAVLSKKSRPRTGFPAVVAVLRAIGIVEVEESS